jgi:asparagine synthase (glutamine-hydrolysing)
MGSIFGIINRQGNDIDREVFIQSLNNLNSGEPTYSGEWIDKHIAFGAGILIDSPKKKLEKLPFFDDVTGCCIVADSRLDYRTELIEKLNIPSSEIENIPDSEIILMSYSKYGEECIHHLYGDFAFAIWDSKKEQVFCARDHFGIKPLVYFESPEYLIISSDVKTIVTIPYVKTEIREEAILDSLMGVSSQKNMTAYKSVYPIEPAHYLVFPMKGRSIKHQYWDLDLTHELMGIDEGQAISEIRNKFENAVRERCKGVSPIGIELSGGLDSTAITSMAIKYAEDYGIPVVSFTNTLLEPELAMNPLFGVQKPIVLELGNVFSFDQQVFLTGDSEKGLYWALEDAMRLYFEPIYHGMSSTQYQLYERANMEGIKALFSGFGGDEGITSNAVGYYEELIRSWKYRSFRKQLKFRINEYGGVFSKLALKYFIRAWLPWIFEFIELVKLYFFPHSTDYEAVAISPNLRKKYRTKAIYYKATKTRFFKSVKEQQYYILMHNHIPDRLEESYLSTKSYRIAYRFPFFDAKLIEYYYSLPTKFKNNQGYGRWIFRKAMEDLLPKEICWQKRKEGPVIPYVPDLFQPDEEKFRKLIDESRSQNKYHYIDYEKLNRGLNQLINRNKKTRFHGNLRIFRNSIGILILQKWQREGKIDIGIKC